jgi:hypothetical protein
MESAASVLLQRWNGEQPVLVTAGDIVRLFMPGNAMHGDHFRVLKVPKKDRKEQRLLIKSLAWSKRDWTTHASPDQLRFHAVAASSC